jgi:hypothetical protein
VAWENHIIYDKPKNAYEIKETDFLFAYTKDDTDTMILSRQIPNNDIEEIIGRVFWVCIEKEEKFTTFEIPDFILYGHSNHTNFRIFGLTCNTNNTNLSDKIVCFSTEHTLNANTQLEYYKTNILSNNIGFFSGESLIFENIYKSMSLSNVLINKEKRYAFIWHHKCGCTTLISIFRKLNNIEDRGENHKIIHSFIPNKYRFNIYLQDIDLISFVRNPYERFLSTFLDKFVYQTDHIFFRLNGYKKYENSYKINNLINLSKFILDGNYISDHFTLMSNTQIYFTNRQNFNRICCKKMENGLNKQIYDFLLNYYSENELNKHKIMDFYENRRNYYEKDETKNEIIDDLAFYDKDKWKEFLLQNKFQYYQALSKELQKNIYRIFFRDFTMFGYGVNYC